MMAAILCWFTVLCWGLSKFVMLISFLRSKYSESKEFCNTVCCVTHIKTPHVFTHRIFYRRTNYGGHIGSTKWKRENAAPN
jgi:hypothetical protein